MVPAQHAPRSASDPSRCSRARGRLAVVGKSRFARAVGEVLAGKGWTIEDWSAQESADRCLSANLHAAVLIVDSPNELLAALPERSVVPTIVVAARDDIALQVSAVETAYSAIVPREASTHQVAEGVHRLAAELARKHVGEVQSPVSWGLESFLRGLRSQMLRALGGDPESREDHELLLTDPRGVLLKVSELCARLAAEARLPHAGQSADFSLLSSETGDPFSAGRLGRNALLGARFLLVDDRLARADEVAQVLRDAGARVALCEPDRTPSELTRLGHLDPIAVIFDPVDLGPRLDTVRETLACDARLRWASVVEVDWLEIWRSDRGVVQAQGLMLALKALAEPDESVRARGDLRASFTVRVENLGVPRLLRALAGCRRPLRLWVTNEHSSSAVDLVEGVVSGASTRSVSGLVRQGTEALGSLLLLGDGLARVDAVTEPELVEITMPIETLLDTSEDREVAPARRPGVLGGYRATQPPPPPLPLPPPLSRAPLSESREDLPPSSLANSVPPSRVPSPSDGVPSVAPVVHANLAPRSSRRVGKRSRLLVAALLIGGLLAGAAASALVIPRISDQISTLDVQATVPEVVSGAAARMRSGPPNAVPSGSGTGSEPSSGSVPSSAVPLSEPSSGLVPSR